MKALCGAGDAAFLGLNARDIVASVCDHSLSYTRACVLFHWAFTLHPKKLFLMKERKKEREIVWVPRLYKTAQKAFNAIRVRKDGLTFDVLVPGALSLAHTHKSHRPH